MPFIVTKTLGREMGSGNLANLWAMLMTAPKSFRKCAERAGFAKGPLMGEEIFKAIFDHPEGLWIGKSDPGNNFADIATEDGKINLHIPEMAEWISEIVPERERAILDSGTKFPLILSSGRHIPFNANTLMRNPEWNEGRRACTCIMNPADADALGLRDGEMVAVSTEAGSVEVELEVTERTRKGYVMIPHGFGLEYRGSVYGANANRLAKNTHRDRFAATPLHRFIPCRVERAR